MRDERTPKDVCGEATRRFNNYGFYAIKLQYMYVTSADCLDK